MTSTPAHSGMPDHFGIRITDADKDKLVGELDVDDRHLNNSGHVHGGALAAFPDDLGGRLAGLSVPPGFRTTTIGPCNKKLDVVYCRKRHGWARTATICSRSLLPESEFLLHKCNR